MQNNLKAKKLLKQSKNFENRYKIQPQSSGECLDSVQTLII